MFDPSKGGHGFFRIRGVPINHNRKPSRLFHKRTGLASGLVFADTVALDETAQNQ